MLALITFLSIPCHAENSNVKVYVNDTRIQKDSVLIDDTTYVPLRAVCEALGANVAWDDASQSVFIKHSEDNTITKAVEAVSPGVVTIIGNYGGDSAVSGYNNLTMHGSGVVYKSGGYIITNSHVVKDIKNLTVVLSNGELYPGTVLCSDETADLAIVKIDRIGLTPLTMANKSDIAAGKTAIAIGTPISLSMRNTVTKGIVSGVGVSVKGSYYKLIQTDATINPGNSGGPLLNINGEVIGITSSKFTNVSIDNVGFAIPSDTVMRFISQYETYGKMLRPNLSFVLEQSAEAEIGLPTEKGLTVKSSDTPFLSRGDIITSVNNTAVHSITDWNEALKDTYDGVGFMLGINSKGTEKQIYIKGE